MNLSSSLAPLVRRALASGGLAGLLSTAALARRSRIETGSPYAALNAPSHWFLGDRALRKNRPSLRYTGTGVATHHVSSLFWALLHERLLGRARSRVAEPPSAARQIAQAALVTGTAAVVDLLVVPPRLTPGFERRLSRASLLFVYAAFGIGLAAGSLLVTQRSR